jgi:hypothetical protein
MMLFRPANKIVYLNALTLICDHEAAVAAEHLVDLAR